MRSIEEQTKDRARTVERPDPWPRIDAELRSGILDSGWEYPWELAPGIHAHARDPLARQTAWVRAAMVEPYALDGLALGEERTALDLNCGEGHLAQRLLDWGARRVLAVSADPEALRRARLLRDHYAIAAGALELLPMAELGSAPEPDIDVVVAFPLVDDELIELAAARSRSVFAFECPEADADRLATAALAAGFASVVRLDPPAQAVSPFLLGQREVLVARKRVEIARKRVPL